MLRNKECTSKFFVHIFRIYKPGISQLLPTIIDISPHQQQLILKPWEPSPASLSLLSLPRFFSRRETLSLPERSKEMGLMRHKLVIQKCPIDSSFLVHVTFFADRFWIPPAPAPTGPRYQNLKNQCAKFCKDVVKVEPKAYDHGCITSCIVGRVTGKIMFSPWLREENLIIYSRLLFIFIPCCC